MDKKAELAEYLVNEYEAGEYYNEMELDEYIRMEFKDNVLNTIVIMEGCDSEEEALEQFIHICMYLYK